MLDLNVGIVSGDSAASTSAMELEKKSSEEDSATSSSSVLSTEDVRRNDAEKNSSSPLIFDILKVQNPSSPEFETRQLYPATVSSTSAKAQWLNFSLVDKSGEAELSIVQPKQLPVPARKSRRGPRSRSSQYRGVTFYRRTGRWESHIWDSGKQVYLGGFDTAYAAARAYDQAAIKFRGVDADINFSLGDYEEAMKQTQNLNKEEFVHKLRRRSTGFPRGSSKYRGVTLQKCGPWEAHMGLFLGNKAYDKATLQCNIREAATNLGNSACEANIVIHANSGGNFYNLDLNLGIGMSSPSNAQKRNVNAKDFHFQYGQVPTRVGRKIENTAVVAPLAGESHTWSGTYPSFLPTLE